MPLLARLFIQQPVISGGLTLVILHSLLCPDCGAGELRLFRPFLTA